MNAAKIESLACMIREASQIKDTEPKQESRPVVNLSCHTKHLIDLEIKQTAVEMASFTMEMASFQDIEVDATIVAFEVTFQTNSILN